MQRGDIYWANIKPRSGSEQAEHRPAIIVSHDIFNKAKNWRSIIAVPLSTSESQAKRGPTAIRLTKKETSLNQISYALCHQITTLDRHKFTQRVSSIPLYALRQIEQGIKTALGMNSAV